MNTPTLRIAKPLFCQYCRYIGAHPLVVTAPVVDTLHSRTLTTSTTPAARYDNVTVLLYCRQRVLLKRRYGVVAVFGRIYTCKRKPSFGNAFPSRYAYKNLINIIARGRATVQTTVSQPEGKIHRGI